MTKRDSGTRHAKGETTTSSASGATTADPTEQRLLAFAEQLGRMIGTIHSKAEGWMDREKLSRQVASVRDGAKQLLDQLATGVASRVRRRPAPKKPVRKARSGGAVDAPGKKHRKPAPAGPPAAAARARNTRVSEAVPRARVMGYRPRQG